MYAHGLILILRLCRAAHLAKIRSTKKLALSRHSSLTILMNLALPIACSTCTRCDGYLFRRISLITGVLIQDTVMTTAFFTVWRFFFPLYCSCCSSESTGRSISLSVPSCRSFLFIQVIRFQIWCNLLFQNSYPVEGFFYFPHLLLDLYIVVLKQLIL